MKLLDWLRSGKSRWLALAVAGVGIVAAVCAATLFGSSTKQSVISNDHDGTIPVSREVASLETRRTGRWVPSEEYPYSMDVQRRWARLDELHLQDRVWTADEFAELMSAFRTPVREIKIPAETTWEDIEAQSTLERAIGGFVDRAINGRALPDGSFATLEDEVIKVLGHRNASMRHAAVCELSILGTASVRIDVREIIRELQNDPDPFVAKSSMMVLRHADEPQLQERARRIRRHYGVR